MLKDQSNYYCPIGNIKYIGREYIDPNMLSNYLIYEYPDEFYLYIPDIAAPGIKPFSYLISNYGKIFSLERMSYLKWMKSKKDYFRIELMVCKYGNDRLIDNRAYSIHRLVAITFSLFSGSLPIYFKNLEINHIDGNKSNNYIGNLEWCTTKYNCYHRDNIINHGIGKLSDYDIKYICDLYFNKGYRAYKIEEITGIHRRTISDILTGKSYQNITKNYIDIKERNNGCNEYDREYY